MIKEIKTVAYNVLSSNSRYGQHGFPAITPSGLKIKEYKSMLSSNPRVGHPKFKSQQLQNPNISWVSYVRLSKDNRRTCEGSVMSIIELLLHIQTAYACNNSGKPINFIRTNQFSPYRRHIEAFVLE